MENDAAWNWVGEHVEQHLLGVIEKTLNAFLHGSDDLYVEEEEAETCAALLVDCTSSATKWKYHTVDLRYWAKARGLRDLATKVVDKLIASDEWLAGWSDEEEKLDVLKELRAELESVKEENKNMEV
jgi:hypothetical protein